MPSPSLLFFPCDRFEQAGQMGEEMFLIDRNWRCLGTPAYISLICERGEVTTDREIPLTWGGPNVIYINVRGFR